MHKKLIMVSILLVAAAVIFASCSSEKSNDAASAAAVTDNCGVTHYYEPVTDKNGTHITNENATVLPMENGFVHPSNCASAPSYTEKNSENISDDNTVCFESASSNPAANGTTAKSTASAATSAQPPATDSAGWITKWY